MGGVGGVSTGGVTGGSGVVRCFSMRQASTLISSPVGPIMGRRLFADRPRVAPGDRPYTYSLP